VFLKPADDVGGDYYDIINSEDNNWVIIGDVSGHGVPAGLVMIMVQASIRAYLGKHPETKPSGLLRDNIIHRNGIIQRLTFPLTERRAG